MKMAGPRVRPVDGRRLAAAADKETEAHYGSAAHKAWRAEVLKRAMFCCQHPGCIATVYTSRLYADHIVERKDGGAELDPENGQALCHLHHQRKTIAERTKRAAG